MKPDEITNCIDKTTSYKTDYEYLFFCEHAIEVLKYYHLSLIEVSTMDSEGNIQHEKGFVIRQKLIDDM
jgi:hypothetical protein